MRRTARGALATALLLVLAAMPEADAAASATPTATAPAPAGKRPAAQGSPAAASHASPYVRAARQRALARAEAQRAPTRVSPFGTAPKPHRPVAPR